MIAELLRLVAIATLLDIPARPIAAKNAKGYKELATVALNESAFAVGAHMHVILRAILAVTVVIAVMYCYSDKTDVPSFVVALVAASLAAQVLIVQKGNLIPFFRAWIIGGLLAAFVYPLDLMKTGLTDIPTGNSYFAALIGCFVAGLWSLAEGRTVFNGRRDSAKPNINEVD